MIVRSHLYFFLVLTIVGGIYCLGLGGPLLFDDGVNLEPLRAVDSGLVPWYVVVFTNPSSTVGRPVSMLSFFINYWLFGFNVVAFKATNILLHLGTGVAAYTFTRRLLRETQYCEHRDRIALVVAGCWLLSPLYVSTVLYVVQRMAILSTLFTLLALSAYLSIREAFACGVIRWGTLCLFCAYALLGVFSKENAVLLPLFLLVLEGFFCAPINDSRGRRLLHLAVAGLIVLPLVASAILIAIKNATFFNYSSRPFGLLERLLTEARVVWSYVGSLLVPRSSDFGLFHDDIPISKNWLSPPSTAFSLFGWLVVVMGVICARKISVWRPIAGAVAFFLVGHLLESTAFALEIYFEHRNYLPGIGAYLLLALAGELAVKNNLLSLTSAKFLIGAYLIVFLVALSQRILIWTRYENIVYSSYEAHPQSQRATIEAASQDAQYGRLDDALAKLKSLRDAKLTPEIGINIQTLWTYCLLDSRGLEDKIPALFGDVSLDGSPYTSLAMLQLNQLLANKPCENVPYAQAVTLLADRLQRYYDTGEYLQPTTKRSGEIASFQTRILEALNLTKQAQKSIDLITSINGADRGNLATDLMWAVALINMDRLPEAKLLIDKLKVEDSVEAKMEVDHITSLQAMYDAHLEKENHRDDN